MDIPASLRSRFPSLLLEENFSFARHTTIACGGTASVAAYPQTEEEAARLLAYLAGNIPCVLLGTGANVLPRDGVFEGVVVRLSRLRRIGQGDGLLFAGAGATGTALLKFAADHGRGGLEPFAGIPMSLGGAVAMNAGVPALHISDVAVRVLACKRGKVCLLPAEDCGFSEKTSIFSTEIAVLGVFLRTEARPPEEISRRMAETMARRSALPKGHSMGCTFVNPAGHSAGALIERCGLKGLRCGRARVSEIHANFIINEGSCAADVARLADTVREEVFKRTGILLREEIRRIP